MSEGDLLSGVKTFRRSYRGIAARPTPPGRTPSEPLPPDVIWIRFWPDFDLIWGISGPNRVQIRSKSGSNHVRGEGRGGGLARRGRSGWNGPVAPRKVLTPDTDHPLTRHDSKNDTWESLFHNPWWIFLRPQHLHPKWHFEGILRKIRNYWSYQKGRKGAGGKGAGVANCRIFRSAVPSVVVWSILLVSLSGLWGEEKVMTIYDAGPLAAGPLCGLLILTNL